jgi:hypothetical protein
MPYRILAAIGEGCYLAVEGRLALLGRIDLVLQLRNLGFPLQRPKTDVRQDPHDRSQSDPY